MLTPIITTQQLRNNHFIFIILTKNIHYCKNNHINSNNNNNGQVKKFPHININKCLRCRQTRQIITDDNLNKNNLDKKTDKSLLVTLI